MFLFRLASRRYPANSGEGARRYGGRWNQPGTPVIYTSATVSLAALEVIVHNGAIPADYQIVVIELPVSLPVHNIELDDPPEDWPESASETETAILGNSWANSLTTAVPTCPPPQFAPKGISF